MVFCARKLVVQLPHKPPTKKFKGWKLHDWWGKSFFLPRGACICVVGSRWIHTPVRTYTLTCITQRREPRLKGFLDIMVVDTGQLCSAGALENEMQLLQTCLLPVYVLGQRFCCSTTTHMQPDHRPFPIMLWPEPITCLFDEIKLIMQRRETADANDTMSKRTSIPSHVYNTPY